MLVSSPSYFWVVAQFLQPVSVISDELPRNLQMELVAKAKQGLEMFLRAELIDKFLPRSTTKAKALLSIINGWVSILIGESPAGSMGDFGTLIKAVDGFSISFQDELDRLPTYTVVAKGNLDIHKLCEGASSGYPRDVLELLDEFITDEINRAGKCLAFELSTACGFHILRAVETGMKGYVYAATGKLPKMSQRNWGEYIAVLVDSGAHQELIDILKVLKTKRNPLMHPQDNLNIDDATALLSLCQAGIETLIADVRRRSLVTAFKESLRALPDL